MKRVRNHFVTLLLLSVVAAQSASAGPSLVFDVASGKVLSQERAGEPWYPASLTKLMTAYVIFKKLKLGQLRLDQTIPVSAVAASQEPSKLGVPAGGTIKLDLALQAMLVYSANDMAYALAEAGGGSVQNFVGEMNATAQTLGLSATHYANPNGLFDPRQLSSARDIGVLAEHIIREYPEHQHYFSQPYVAVGKRKLANRNSLMRTMPEADGMKTGFVCNSGFNLVASATRNGRRLVSVVLGASSGNARAELAKLMLIDGFSKQPNAIFPDLGTVKNLPLGGIVPADLTTSVCKTNRIASAKSAKDVSGWGISFGTYDEMAKADMALRGRLIGPLAVNINGTAGVIRMPDKSGFAALVWNIDQPTGISVCNALRAQNATCSLITPEVSTSIAMLAQQTEPPEPVLQQGAGDKPRAKARKGKGKRIKKKFN